MRHERKRTGEAFKFLGKLIQDRCNTIFRTKPSNYLELFLINFYFFDFFNVF